MNEELQQLKREMEELKKWKADLESSTTVPLNIRQSLLSGLITTGDKSASSENQSVDEGGVALYSVLKPPDVFRRMEIEGTIYYIPLYT